jgi:hypothetical protein
MKHIAVIVLALAISLTAASNTCLAYGGGGGGGGNGGAEDHEHASGGVSWTPNPNGEGVIGSSVWRGPRPAGPFQEDKSIQDALDDLVRGMGTEFTDEQVRANMDWARRAGVLEGIKVPSKLTAFLNPSGSQTSKHARRAQRQADAIGIAANVWGWLQDQKKKGKDPSAQDIENHVKKQIIKHKTKGVIDLDKPEESAVKLLEKAKDALSDALNSYLKK